MQDRLNLIDPREVHVGWITAKKTKPILAAPIDILIHSSLPLHQLVLKTLEGLQALEIGTMVCLGASGDYWQQKEKALLKKYDLTGFKNGWSVFTPKPEAEMQALPVTPEMANDQATFHLVGLYGQELGGQKNIQTGAVGDFIVTNGQADDYWIVARAMFEATYELVGARSLTPGESSRPERTTK
jgi:hypothetical protein